jgi:hypothetical protein
MINIIKGIAPLYISVCANVKLLIKEAKLP